MAAHGASYSTPLELRHRRGVYASNVARINAHNAGVDPTDHTAVRLGATRFADLSADEFKGLFDARIFAAAGALDTEVQGAFPAALPSSVDWVLAGFVGPVANQGALGTDWAFAGTEAVESNAAIASGRLVSLSLQQLASCADQTTWQKYTQVTGLCSQADYPPGSGTCHDSTCSPAARVSKWVNVQSSNETALMQALVSGTVYVAVEADQSGEKRGQTAAALGRG